MNVGTSLESDTETPEVLQRHIRALGDPAPVPTTAPVRLLASDNASTDAVLVQNPAESIVIVTTSHVAARGTV
ncbi:hypothetical protein BDI24065_06103 [Burkholderia diffusa]|uniref:Uncharacterized protein n=1 Tax=Burkholderia diffusa TaxID=488732 RepID=A0A6P2QZF2_9BURK|nr:hypothetical protein BDI24065_06103 [Burkholderia diffusa]